MPRRKAVPPVAKPTGRRRFIEICKDVLIVGLTCSALLLAWQTPLVTQLRGWVSPPVQAAEPAARQPREAVAPYGLAARNSMGLYVAVYDAGQVEGAFDQLSPLLGEGFATAGAPERASRTQWQRLLGSPGVYCAFQGSLPLSVLSSWMGEGEGQSDGRAQALLLAWDGQRVWLCWRDGDSYYRVPTQVAYEGHMDAVLESFQPNGAFAYTLAQTDRAYEPIDPDVLIPMTAPQPQGYTVSAPDLVGDAEALEQLLAALGFQSGVGSAYEAGGGLTINESGDRLRVSADGTVAFHAGEESRYPVPAQTGDRPTAEAAATAAWTLLNRAAAPWKGETTAFVLTGAEETGAGWNITFHSRVEGVPLRMGTEGWTASVTVAGERIADFTLHLRGYAPTGETSLLPSQRLAAAALGSEVYRDNGKRLLLSYTDTGAALTAGWVAEE